MMHWNNSLKSGIPIIDQQHREMFKQVELLQNQACTRGERIRDTLSFLEEHVLMHFGTEELFMKRYRYPDTEAHASEHDGFVGMFAKLKGEYEKSREDLYALSKLTRGVLEWLKMHIVGSDMELTGYLKAAGCIGNIRNRRTVLIRRFSVLNSH